MSNAPNYQLVDTEQLDTDLTSVANAIRTKGGTTEELTFPQGFVDAVDGIEEKNLEQILEQYPSNVLISPQVDLGDYSYQACWGAMGIDFLNLENINNSNFSNSGFDIIRFRKVSEINGIPFSGAVTIQYIFESLCTINDSQAIDELANAEIFVPRDLIDSFKNDTNWAIVAESIVSIEDNLERLSQYFPDLVDKYGGNEQ